MSVEESWGRILTWCAANAPKTAAAVTPSAGGSVIETTQARFPHPRPADLRAWAPIG